MPPASSSENAVSIQLRVFLASSGEATKYMDEIAECLRKEGVERVLPWTDKSAFPVGKTYIESLEGIVSRCNCALVIASPDDKTVTRGETELHPRDNVILEYGMFMTAFGRDRAALAIIGTPTL